MNSLNTILAKALNVRNVKKFKCKFCGSIFEEERRYLNHKKIHGRKSKVFYSDSFGDASHAAGASYVTWGFVG